MLLSRIVRLLLIVADAFLALTAIAGGIGLLAGLNRPPVDLLQGSPFSDYTIPGLSLLVIVGGGALLTTVLLLRRHPYATLIAGASGIVIIGFEMIEILIIGSPAGISRYLQVFYITLGLGIITLAGVLLAAAKRPAGMA